MYSSESAASCQNDILLRKVFLVGCCKNFVGTGLRKISKAEIKRSTISEMTDIVSNLAEYSSFPLLSTYCLGICRIYEKAANFLLEDLAKFNDELNSALFGVCKPPSKSKKTQSTMEQDKFLDIKSVHSMELCEESVFIPLFQRNIETDQNLLHEIDIPEDPVDTLGDFGDEIIHFNQQIGELREGPSEWLSPSDEVARMGQSIINDFQITGGGEIHASTPAVIPSITHQERSTGIYSPRSTAQSERRDRTASDRPVASTPKRNTHQAHDETPKKRQRKSPPLENGHSEERSTTARRLFDEDGQRSLTPAHEIMLDGVEGNGVETFHEHMPLEGFNEEARRSSSHQVDSVPNLEQNRESMPTAADVPEDVQLRPGQLLEDIDDLQLEELNDETIAALIPKRRKRLKKWQDDKKQIEKPLDINEIKKFINVHTKEPELTLVNLQKQSVADLLSLPATRWNPRGPCTAGKTLLNLYFERARPILHVNDETPARSSIPRDANVNKKPRFSTFRRDSKQRPSAPSTSTDRNITSEGDNVYNQDRDKELMPPPPSPRVCGRLPEIYIDSSSLPLLDQQQSLQRQLPGTPTRRPIRSDTPGVSPRQFPSVSNNLEPAMADIPDDDLVNPPDFPFGASRRGDGDLDPQSHHMIERSSSSISINSERERSFLMNIETFYQFLKDMWVDRFDKVDLVVVIPRRPSLVTFFRYFVFLQRLQKDGKLTMLQEIIYGPVHIVKERE